MKKTKSSRDRKKKLTSNGTLQDIFRYSKIRSVASNHAYLPTTIQYYSLSMTTELWPEISTRTLFIAGQSLQGSHSQLGITVNSFRSHTGCFTLLVQSEMGWLQRSHCFLYEGSAVLRNGDCVFVPLYYSLLVCT